MKNQRLKALVLLVVAGAAAAGLVAWLLLMNEGRPPTSAMAVAVVLGIVVVVSSAIGVDALLRGKAEQSGVPSPPADYRHAKPLFLLIGAAAVAALVVRQLLVPDSFGEIGYFRADAIGEEMQRQPRHIGNDECRKCHEKQASLHDKDAHARVACEDCHGPGWKHARAPEKNKLVKPSTKDRCLICHRLLDARPGDFPQIEWREHFRFVGVADLSVQCTQCHDPHEPLYMDRDINTARLHPLIHRCRDCHTSRVNESLPRPDRHPAIFECSYCHAPIVADFQKKPHSKVRCTTCHLFFKISDFAGRIIRDADPRFCLLCHREADFRSESAAPGISWPDHLDDVAESDEDRQKRCIDCHRERIHRLIKETGHEQQD